ncbi:hypothetical protein [Microcoleus sp. S13C4]|uniref:hypothetical protein n=1 Tax=Microcoleus sp. S13C4 TaxID=3055410 RepID=UPI002FD396FA
MKEEGRRKKEEGRRKKEEGRRKKEEGRCGNAVIIFLIPGFLLTRQILVMQIHRLCLAMLKNSLKSNLMSKTNLCDRTF